MRKAEVLLVVLALVPAAAAQTVTDQPVRVYTNADLALLGPLPAARDAEDPRDEARSNDEENWKFVADFIDRERAKINVDRVYDLERVRVENEAREDRGYGMPYFGYYGYYRNPYPYGSHRGKPHVHRGDRSRTGRAHVPHRMFRDNPPVREHVPGLGSSYRRGAVKHPSGRYRASN